MKAGHLFFRRVKKSYRENYRVLKAIGDWTIWVYLVIPFTIFFAIQYVRWLETPSPIVAELPVLGAWLIFYFLSWIGQIRPFVEEADPVFLMKKPAFFIQLKRYALIYGLLKQVFILIIVSILFYPLLIKPFFTVNASFIWFILFWIVLNWLQITLKRKIKRLPRLLSIPLSIIIFVAGMIFVSQISGVPLEQSLFWIVLITAIASVSLFLLIKHMIAFHTFRHDLLIEQEERSKWTSRIFMMAREIEPPKVIRRKKPIMFRRGETPLLLKRNPENGYLELFIKVFFRNGSYALGYLQLISVTCGAFLVIPSLFIKTIILLGFIFMILYWLNQLTEKIISSSGYGKQFKERLACLTAQQRFARIFGGIAFVFVLFVFILTIHDPLAGIRAFFTL